MVQSSPAKRFALVAFLVGWLYLIAPFNILTFFAGWDARDSDEAFAKGNATRPPSEVLDSLPTEPDDADDPVGRLLKMTDPELYFPAVAEYLRQCNVQRRHLGCACAACDQEAIARGEGDAEEDGFYWPLSYAEWLQSQNAD